MHNFKSVCNVREVVLLCWGVGAPNVVVIESLWLAVSGTSGLLLKLTYITWEAETFYNNQNIDLDLDGDGFFKDTLVLLCN